MKRREFFLPTSSSASAAALDPFPPQLFASPARKSASARVKRGPMGASLSRLAMGTGADGTGSSSSGWACRERRICSGPGTIKASNFRDSADRYGRHPHLQKALKGVAREKIPFTTKIGASTGARSARITSASCCSIAGEKGIVRTHRTSSHAPDAPKATRTPRVQVDLARINPAAVAMDADPRTLIGVLRQMKGILGMKILGAGKLRDKAGECLRFALALDCMDCMTIGSESRAELSGPVKKIPGAPVRG